ncbi:hypothetical protein [Mycolicibacterium sp. XJ1819]
MTEHEHFWTLDSINPAEPAAGGVSRMVKLVCACGATMDKLTLRSDAEIAAELEAQRG